MSRVPKALVALALFAALAACNSSPTGPGLQVTPGTVSVESGSAVQLTVSGPEAGGGTNIVWTSSNPVAAQVDENGVVTGVYANGSAVITATVGSARGAADVATVPRLCIALAPLEGTPDPAAEIQNFEIRFEAGVNAQRKATLLADRYGFAVIEVLPDGFVADLKPDQAGSVQCDGDVELVSYR